MVKSSEPKIRGLRSLRMMMQAGKFNYCACGRTENNPFCDGSHYESTDIKPILVVFEFQQEVKWCDCRNSKNLPFCDHSHRKLPGNKPK